MTRILMPLKLILAAFIFTISSAQAEQITVTDLAGRTVTLNAPVQTMVLGEGRFLPSIAILDRDNPLKRIVGMMAEFKKLDPSTYSQYLKHYPKIDEIPLIGSSGAATFNIETSLAVRPDVAIFGISSGHGPNDRSKTVLDQFESAGIPVLFVDFRIDPLVNTPKSLRLLGDIMGREKQAEGFLSFYDKELAKVANRVKSIENRPTVFMESRVGLRPECCEAIGSAMMGRFIEWAGGVNAYGQQIPGTHGMINREHLLVHQPDVYIGTAIGSEERMKTTPQFLALGANTSQAAARQSLQQALTRKELASLTAVKEGRAFAIWHHFYNTPMNVTAVQVIAKWLHPNLFADLEPEQTLKTYFEKFQPVPLDGTYWVSAR
ncbi:MAG: ABC transporter substrate-binding protein [Sneathiella sp.]|nr:ABC transporter substrate-binding protein [Sneathiella sp.]